MAYRNYRSYNFTPLWVLIGINVIMYIVVRVEPDLVLSLGLIPVIIAERPWTMLTSIFLHGSLWHVLANMVTLYFFGRYLCVLLGEWKFLTVFFIGGIVGNVFYLLLGEPISIAIGASGAVFALGGVLAVMRPKIRVVIFPVPAPLPLWVAVIGLFLFIGVFLAIWVFPGVAWQAHLGGLAFGLAMGYFFKKRERAFR